MILQLLLCVWVSECVAGVVGVRLGVGCPCPPVRDIVTPRHLYYPAAFLLIVDVPAKLVGMNEVKP